MASAAARRYARALFELASQDREFAGWRRRIESVGALFGDEALGAALLNRGVPAEQRLDLLRDLGASLDPEALNLGLLLLENGRVADAGGVLEEYDRLVDAAEGRVRATATTAVELSDEERRGLERELGERFGGRVRLETEVDPDILGGLVVRVGDHLVDASVRTRLQQLRRRLASAST